MTVTQTNFNLHRTVTYNQAISIGNLNSLSTVAKDSIVNAINELTSSTSTIGNLASLTTDDQSSIVNAINEVDGNSDANAVALGTLSSLTTTNKASGVDAINEHDSEIGDVSSLQTTVTTDLVTSINSLIGPMVQLSCNSQIASLYFAVLCCGDNVIQGIETCDDGNQISGDGCNSNCKQEEFNLSTLDGTNGFIVSGINPSDQSGSAFSTTRGDFNGDNIDDLLIAGRFAASTAGQTYVIFGSKAGFSASLSLSSLDGTNGFTINGIDASDVSSVSLDFIGDFNGDGVDDIVIGASGADPNGNSGAGEAYIVFGHKGAFAATFELSSLDGSNGVIFNGIAAGDGTGISVAYAGDVNADGFEDVIIGSHLSDPLGRTDAGEAYLVFGTDVPYASSTVELSSLDGSNGVIFYGAIADDRFGVSVNRLRDFNGDGVDDIIMSADRADPNGSSSGQIYIVYGQSTGFTSPFEVSSLNGVNGAIINGIDIDDEAGFRVNYGGDFNNDGLSDIMIGAELADPNGDASAGEVYLIFGSKTFSSPFELSTLNGSNGIIFEGIDADDIAGYAVSALDDFNLDGISEILFCSKGGDPNAATDSGECYMIFGSESAFASPFDLATLDGNNGFYINGVDAGDFMGFASGSADINGDGLTDAVMGSRRADSFTGETYVVFGHL